MCHAGIDSAIGMRCFQTTTGFKQLINALLILTAQLAELLLQQLATVHLVLSGLGVVKGTAHMIKPLQHCCGIKPPLIIECVDRRDLVEAGLLPAGV